MMHGVYMAGHARQECTMAGHARQVCTMAGQCSREAGIPTLVCTPSLPTWYIPTPTTLGIPLHLLACWCTPLHCLAVGERGPGLKKRGIPWVRALQDNKVDKCVRIRREGLRRVTPLFLHRMLERLDRRRVILPLIPY